MRFYSRNPKACKLLKAAWEWLKRHDSELQMRFIPGIFMAADQTSRLETLDDLKVKESWKRLQLALELPRKKSRDDKKDPEYE